MFSADTHVLVVDDMMTMRKIVSKTVGEMGFSKISQAEDGRAAWSLIQEAEVPVGLVISDWNMPNMSGLDLLKAVRSHVKYQNLPFLLVTAEAEKGQVAEALKAGVDSYVVKPFSKDGLREKLEAVYKKRCG